MFKMDMGRATMQNTDKVINTVTRAMHGGTATKVFRAMHGKQCCYNICKLLASY